MKSFHRLVAVLLPCFIVAGGSVQAQPDYNEIGLNDKTDFTDVPASWRIVGDVWYSLARNNLKEEPGTGILVNDASGSQQGPLITKMQHGSMVIEFEFMLATGSSSAVYLQGRYGISLTDSWSSNISVSESCGYLPEVSRKQPGTPPRMNIARSPGLWQRLRIAFQAPEFNADGRKQSDARLLQVSLNGVLIHEDIALPGISYTELFTTEVAKGPLVFSGDGRIAIRNIRYFPFGEQQREEVLLPTPLPTNGTTPLILTPTRETIVQRCFMAGETQTLTSCAVVGEPSQIHYAINLEQGALIRLWKGAFIDATTMWQDRGAIQLARPLGSVVELSSQPVFAHLSNRDAAWPDSMQQGYHFVHYRLDKRARPTFNYSFRGLEFTDEIVPADNDRILTRTLRVAEGKPKKDLWILLAAGSDIERLGDGLYGVDDKNYYVRLDAGRKKEVILRESDGREELLISGRALTGDGFTWSFIW